MEFTWFNSGIIGDAPDQLTTPKGIFLMKRTNTLYVADFGNKRVQMFSLGTESRNGREEHQKVFN
jgi:sugar lactone lactonase YvrE